MPPPAPAPPPPRPVPPPPVPVVQGAPGEATRVGEGGIRVTFGPGSSDLNPGTEAALRDAARAARANEQVSLYVNAYAAGQPDDPSTPRRLSLARALAARAVLISEGIASTRIYVKALGPSTPDGPPDRVDVLTTPAAPVAATAGQAVR